MKLIVAMIPEDKRGGVEASLAQLDVAAMYMGEVLDLKDQAASMYRGAAQRLPRVKVRVEVPVVNDKLTYEVVNAIEAACGPMESGQANIFVMPMEEWIPVRGAGPRYEHPVAA